MVQALTAEEVRSARERLDELAVEESRTECVSALALAADALESVEVRLDSLDRIDKAKKRIREIMRTLDSPEDRRTWVHVLGILSDEERRIR